MYIYYITYEDAFSRHGFSMEQPHRTPQTELTVETLYYFASWYKDIGKLDINYVMTYR